MFRELLSSWSPARVDGRCRATVRGPDQLGPDHPVDPPMESLFAKFDGFYSKSALRPPSPLQELVFWRVGTTEIEKSDFSSHDPGLCQVSFYITRVCRTRLDGSNPLKLCYMSRSRYNEFGPPTYLAEILEYCPPNS